MLEHLIVICKSNTKLSKHNIYSFKFNNLAQLIFTTKHQQINKLVNFLYNHLKLLKIKYGLIVLHSDSSAHQKAICHKILLLRCLAYETHC